MTQNLIHNNTHTNNVDINKSTDNKAGNSSQAGLKAKGISIEIDERILFEQLNFTVQPGEVLTLMGPSGTGKSTLLAFISGTLSAGIQAQGEMYLNGVDITSMPPESRKIGLLFQDALLFPHLSVGDNLSFGLTSNIRGAARRAHIENALNAADLAGYADHDPATLSGGERSRVALMRTLLAEPSAILLDEPFSKLDMELRQQMRQFTFSEITARGLPCLMVSHDQQDAAAAAGPVLQLNARI